MSSLPISRAEQVVRSGFRLLRAVYLVELERLEHGIPDGALMLSGGLQLRAHQEALFAVAADPAFQRWQQLTAERLFGQARPMREAVLQMADDALVARRFRRAVQLYGWLLLTSRAPDNAFEWSTRHLRRLHRELYRPRSEA
ncbi:MAG: hypothetical protein L6Q75_10995 [Burkholderiaceae bacterium]|nr:hypothetical protein [Burkholderiaceae bacterium]